MLARLRSLFGRAPRDEAALREEQESRLRAEQEARAAELGKSEDQRGVEGFSQRYLGPR